MKMPISTREAKPRSALRIEEVAHVGLGPPLTHRVDTALVGLDLRGGRRMRREQPAGHHGREEQESSGKHSTSNCQVWGHAGQSNHAPTPVFGGSRRSSTGPERPTRVTHATAPTQQKPRREVTSQQTQCDGTSEEHPKSLVKIHA